MFWYPPQLATGMNQSFLNVAEKVLIIETQFWLTEITGHNYITITNPFFKSKLSSSVRKSLSKRTLSPAGNGTCLFWYKDDRVDIT